MAGSTRCVPVRDDTVDGPSQPGSMQVTALTTTPEVIERTAASLAATASGGIEPYTFRWDQNGGPIDVTVLNAQSASTNTSPLNQAGRYNFRVVATDAQGETAVDYVTVEATPGVAVGLSANPRELDEGHGVTLSAALTNGTEPFTFVWELESGPTELDLSGITGSSFTTDPLTEPGEYVFKVTVTDSLNFENSDTVTVTVNAILSVDSPELALAGEPVELSASLEQELTDAVFAWEVIAGAGQLADASTDTASLTTSGDETVLVQLTVTGLDANAEPVELHRELNIISISSQRPRALLTTNFGAFTIELRYDAAPLHATQFLAYIEEGYYDGILFHRNSWSTNPDTNQDEPFVLQGGAYKRVDGELEEQEPTRENVPSEADNGLSNATLYSIALALRGGNADSGNNQFYINLTDNSFLDDQGFTVFAEVVEGTAVVDDIVQMERTDSPIIPGEVSLPVDDVVIESITRVTP